MRTVVRLVEHTQHGRVACLVGDLAERDRVAPGGKAIDDVVERDGGAMESIPAHGAGPPSRAEGGRGMICGPPRPGGGANGS